MKKILIVDDEEGARNGIEQALESPGRQIFLAASGLEGIAIFEKERPDLLIIDVEMPGMSGDEVISFIKDKGWPVTAIVISASLNIEVCDRMLKLGCRKFLEKPFNVDELVRLVSELLGE